MFWGWIGIGLRNGGDVDSRVTVTSSSLKGKANSVLIFLSETNATHS